MPIYEYRCTDCGQKIEVARRMSESSVGPTTHCRCGADSWKKMVSKPARAICERSENSPWPAKVVGRDGVATIVKSDAEHRAWMDSQGYVRTADGMADSTFSEKSQHTTDRNDGGPPPSGRAVEIADAMINKPKEFFGHEQFV